ncbi:hypothetical protein [Lentzea flava]|uniref:Uncharacterized protein n=1 Tax=Lentzea flava TaxID=103732 RepID=A0ABQ2V9V2_9PSEU|nr:hypothetical protein [Lentzea flava]MCP2203790.1 hypothetical protein [Lentzea flava]GGU71775.1 hypothetical protein GCM10010178_74250 [Lentzea flava]
MPGALSDDRQRLLSGMADQPQLMTCPVHWVRHSSTPVTGIDCGIRLLTRVSATLTSPTGLVRVHQMNASQASLGDELSQPL